MTFLDLRKKEGKISGLVALERSLPNAARAKTKRFLILFAPVIVMALLALENFGLVPAHVLYSLMFLIAALWLCIFMIDAFYYSHYFDGAFYSVKEWGIEDKRANVPFEVLEIVSLTESSDFSGGFVESRPGSDIFARLDLTKEEADVFLKSNRKKVYADPIEFGSPVALGSYVATVFDADEAFQVFLSTHNITREAFIGAASWVSDLYERRKELYRWWGRDSLGRIRGIGKEWSKSETYLLEQYGSFVKPEDGEALFKKEIDSLEHTLVQSSMGNVLLVSDEHSKSRSVIAGLASRMSDGSVLPQLEHKKIFMLDIAAIDASAAAVDGEFERLVIRLFNQAAGAEHVILVISDLPAFVQAARKRNLDIFEIIEPYLITPRLNVVAFLAKQAHEELSEQQSVLKKYFKVIVVEHDTRSVIIRALERKTIEVERMTNLFFTYHALAAITEHAHARMPADVIERRALELFDQVVPRLVQRGARKVTANIMESIFALLA